MHFVLDAVSSALRSLTTEKMWVIVADRIGVPIFTILSIVSIVIVVLSALSNVHKTVRNPEV